MSSQTTTSPASATMSSPPSSTRHSRRAPIMAFSFDQRVRQTKRSRQYNIIPAIRHLISCDSSDQWHHRIHAIGPHRQRRICTLLTLLSPIGTSGPVKLAATKTSDKPAAKKAASDKPAAAKKAATKTAATKKEPAAKKTAAVKKTPTAKKAPAAKKTATKTATKTTANTGKARKTPTAVRVRCLQDS